MFQGGLDNLLFTLVDFLSELFLQRLRDLDNGGWVVQFLMFHRILAERVTPGCSGVFSSCGRCRDQAEADHAMKPVSQLGVDRSSHGVEGLGDLAPFPWRKSRSVG